MPAYITATGACLPNAPIGNDETEDLLGRIGGRASRLRDVILASNQIRSRYYAIDPTTRRQTHTNAELTAEAVMSLADSCDMDIDAIDLLACGTSSPDQLIPGHANMVHGLIGGRPCETHSTAGVCCAGIAALKYAMLGISAHAFTCAVVTGSDLPSPRLTAEHFDSIGGGAPPGDEAAAAKRKLQGKTRVGFDTEFLRWMLSDGAGALRVEPTARPGRLSLRIDWVELVSFAHELESCMYAGALKRPDGSLRGWMQEPDLDVIRTGGYLSLHQDVRLLNTHIVPNVMRRSLEQVISKHGLEAAAIDWVLPHLSSFYFESSIHDLLREIGFEIAAERWFTNLADKGNTGAASAFIMIDELYRSGRLQPGQRLLCVVPESARFSFAYLHLTVE